MSIAPCAAMRPRALPASSSKIRNSRRNAATPSSAASSRPTDAVAKIRVAVDARPSRDFLIVARTDARYAEGMDAALRRAEGFLNAGADVLFVESPESLEEIAPRRRDLQGRDLAGEHGRGRPHTLSVASELAAMGFKIALFPGSGFLTAAGALQLVYRNLKTAGIGTGSEAPMLSFADMNNLMGFPAVHAFEKRYGLADNHKE